MTNPVKHSPCFFLESKNRLTPLSINLPLPAVPYSVLGSNLARNNTYIQNDIWPVAPLADPSFITFTRNLPRNMKENKRILRPYQEEKDYPKSIHSPGRNENFAPFFVNTLKSKLPSFFNKLFKNSHLQRMKLINENELLEEYNDWRKDKKEINPLFFYSATVIEVLLQSLEK